VTTKPNTNRVENNNTSREKVSSTKMENGNNERPMRYPAEDIRFKNKPPIQNIVPIPIVQQAPLVSNVYQDDDEEEEEDDDEQSDNIPINQCKLRTH